MNGNSTTTPKGQADIPDLSRVTFFDGQRLVAGDLNDAATVQRELRWLHNRSLHAWGIGLGFAVSGAKDDRQVQVGPGYAIDCRGREIILTETISKAVPARSDKAIFYLVAAYPDDTKLAVLERRQGECQSDGAVRLQERAAIYWKAQGEQTVENGVEIVLAQATVENCQLAAPLSLEQRRSARSSQQPFVAAGSTSPSQTSWSLWTTLPNGTGEVLGLQAEISTAEARFGAVPEYQAQLRGQRFIGEGQAGPHPAFVLEGMSFVSAPGRTAFTFQVLMPTDLLILGSVPINPGWLFDPPENLLEVVKTRWSVVWVGVEG